MKKLRTILVLILIGVVAISAVTLLLPAPPDAVGKQFYLQKAASISLIDVLTAVGSSILFFMALRSFKPELKAAYRLLAFSTLAVGLGLLIFPYIEYYDLWDITWLDMSSYAQYLVGAPLMYFGVRKFYKQLGLKAWPGNLLVVAGILVAVWCIHIFIPRNVAETWDFTERVYDAWSIIPILPAVIYPITLAMVLKLRRATGQSYTKAFTWLAVGLFFYTCEAVSISVLDTVGFDTWYFNSRFIIVPAILGDLSFLTAGYQFNAISLPQSHRRSWLQRWMSGGEAPATSMDIIIYAAQMASDQSKIDRYLDGMRAVTVHHQADAPLSSDEQHKLRDVYLAIERQLVEEDALRDFDKTQLRADIVQRFDLGAAAGNNTFWSVLGA